MSSSPPDASRPTALADIDVAILAGGLGTRLRGVIDEALPKVLAPVSGRPFLDHMLDWLAGFGARRVVLCLGHRAEAVRHHLSRHSRAGLVIETSIEPRPLGTAGALRLAAPLLRSDPVLVINGDTFIDADLAEFVAAHGQSGARASVLCASVPSTARYGRLEIDAKGNIARFAEKDASLTGPGQINAGLYLFSRAWFESFARGRAESLERDVFAAAPSGEFHAISAGPAEFIDIGTPESFAAAAAVFARAAGRAVSIPA